MPRGVYDRKTKKDKAAGGGRKARDSKGFAGLVAKMRAEKMRAEDRVVALGTAIELLEDLE